MAGTGAQDEVRKVIDETLEALNAGDAGRLRSMLAERPDGVHIGTDPGEWETSKQVVEAVAAAGGADDIQVVADGIGIHIRGDVAWAEGHGRFTRAGGGARSPWPATTPACGSATPWPPITPAGSTGWPWPRPPSPGVSPSPPLFASAHLNNALWHFAFNRLAEVNDQLATGREDVYFGWQFATKAAKKLPDYAVRYYVDTLTDPEALHASFAIYRALDITIAQNQQRKSRRLTLPVLAIGGAHSLGEQVAGTMKLAADDVQSLVIPGCGHHPAEETPEETLAALTAFLARYRDGTATAHNPRPHAAVHQPLAAGDDASSPA